jgi:hypothetical protein
MSDSTAQTDLIGFRIVRLPEPRAGALAAMAVLALAALRRLGASSQPQIG